jgi:hypothetical protein
MKKAMLTKHVLLSLLLTIAILFFSCSDKKEYEMELKFQRQLTAQSLYENDRILMRIEKEIVDSGKRPNEVAILNHAQHIVDIRNKYIDAPKSVDVLLENINGEIQSTDSGNNSLVLLKYFQKKLTEKSDSLVLQKFLNTYLTFERKVLNEDLAKVSGIRCSWGSDLAAHVVKTIDTVSVGQLYELAVIPETFNYKMTYVTDSCDITVYCNDVAVEMKPIVVRKGFVYLISLTPNQPGDYKIRGTFNQRSYIHSYVLKNVFGDRFVVIK